MKKLMSYFWKDNSDNSDNSRKTVSHSRNPASSTASSHMSREVETVVNGRVEVTDRHGDFLYSKKAKAPVKTVETYDRHGNFTGNEEVRPYVSYEETYDRHGNFTGNEEVRRPVETREIYDRHGNFIGNEAVSGDSTSSPNWW